MPEQKLVGKVACVTGAGTGIGVGIAIALAEAGADVCVGYFGSAEGARETALLQQADVADSGQARGLVDATVERLGRIDVMVNNSGVTWPKPFLELDDETWDRTFGINLRGMFLCSQQAARHMVRQGAGGRIVNLSSVHGFSATTRHVHYEATKGGINMFHGVPLAPADDPIGAEGDGRDVKDLHANAERRTKNEERRTRDECQSSQFFVLRFSFFVSCAGSSLSYRTTRPAATC